MLDNYPPGAWWDDNAPYHDNSLDEDEEYEDS